MSADAATRDLRRQLRIARHLATKMSTWIYSAGPPPAKLNQLFLDWIERGKLPASFKEIGEAERD